jgi:hypothetical protein
LLRTLYYNYPWHEIGEACVVLEIVQKKLVVMEAFSFLPLGLKLYNRHS